MESRVISVVIGVCAAFGLTAGVCMADDNLPKAPEDELILAEPSVPAGDLGDMSGGTEVDEINFDDLNINAASNVTNVIGNSVGDNVKTGFISNNTLSNVKGINSLMYNTGNNVSFSSNMQFNIDLQ